LFTSSFSVEGLKSLLSGKDPVCGMEVEAAKAFGVSNHNGTAFYFCSEACKKAFDAEPAKYPAKA